MERMPKAMVKAEVCGTCAHYRQHYVLVDKGRCYMPLWYGHCNLPMYKHASPDETCDRWEESPGLK